jgi:hypothetical protein
MMSPTKRKQMAEYLGTQFPGVTFQVRPDPRQEHEFVINLKTGAAPARKVKAAAARWLKSQNLGVEWGKARRLPK